MKPAILLTMLFVLPGLSTVIAEAAEPQAEWLYLDNGEVRLGIDKRSGGAIGFFAPSGKKNLLNHYDRGRFIQQSYYGKEDGTNWAGKPWRWNPVQGGDYKGGPPKLLDVSSDKTSLNVKSIARHW